MRIHNIYIYIYIYSIFVLSIVCLFLLALCLYPKARAHETQLKKGPWPESGWSLSNHLAVNRDKLTAE